MSHYNKYFEFNEWRMGSRMRHRFYVQLKIIKDLTIR